MLPCYYYSCDSGALLSILGFVDVLFFSHWLHTNSFTHPNCPPSSVRAFLAPGCKSRPLALFKWGGLNRVGFLILLYIPESTMHFSAQILIKTNTKNHIHCTVYFKVNIFLMKNRITIGLERLHFHMLWIYFVLKVCGCIFNNPWEMHSVESLTSIIKHQRGFSHFITGARIAFSLTNSSFTELPSPDAMSLSEKIQK